MATVNLQATELEPLARLLPEEGVLPRVKTICTSKDQTNSGAFIQITQAGTQEQQSQETARETNQANTLRSLIWLPRARG
jgi:hypothetical protein